MGHDRQRRHGTLARVATLLLAAAVLGACEAAAPVSPSPTAMPTPSPAVPSTPTPTPSPTAALPTAPSPTPTATPSPTLSPSPTTTPTPTPTPTPAATPATGSLGLDWTLAARGTGHAVSIAYGPAGWAYQVSYDTGFGNVPAVRTSPDLRTWTERTAKGASVAGTDICIAGTASAYVMAYGRIFASADGRTWTRGAAAVSGAGPVKADCVISDGRRFVAWTEWQGQDGLWVSAAGRTWTKVALPGANALVIDAIAARPDGGFVAAGRAGDTIAALDAAVGTYKQFETLPGRQAVWTSGDGRTWKQVPLGGTFDGKRVSAIAAGGPGGGVVALVQAGRFGQDNEDDLSIETWRWTKAGGWRELRGKAFTIDEAWPGDARVIATQDRWLLVGARTLAGRSHPGVTAGSDNGSRWWAVRTRSLGTSKAQYFIDGVAAARGRLVFLVNMSGLASRPVRVWVSP